MNDAEAKTGIILRSLDFFINPAAAIDRCFQSHRCPRFKGCKSQGLVAKWKAAKLSAK
jgi:hypothetical protein